MKEIKRKLYKKMLTQLEIIRMNEIQNTTGNNV